MQKLTDEQMAAKTAEFRDRLAHGEALDELVPEAYALVREATWRLLGNRQVRFLVWRDERVLPDITVMPLAEGRPLRRRAAPAGHPLRGESATWRTSTCS